MSIEATPIAWTVRYNADGHTFEAACVVTHCLNGRIEVHMAMSLKPRALIQFKREMRAYFLTLGYTVSRWMHNGNVIEERLD